MPAMTYPSRPGAALAGGGASQPTSGAAAGGCGWIGRIRGDGRAGADDRARRGRRRIGRRLAPERRVGAGCVGVDSVSRHLAGRTLGRWLGRCPGDGRLVLRRDGIVGTRGVGPTVLVVGWLRHRAPLPCVDTGAMIRARFDVGGMDGHGSRRLGRRKARPAPGVASRSRRDRRCTRTMSGQPMASSAARSANEPSAASSSRTWSARTFRSRSRTRTSPARTDRPSSAGSSRAAAPCRRRRDGEHGRLLHRRVLELEGRSHPIASPLAGAREAGISAPGRRSARACHATPRPGAIRSSGCPSSARSRHRPPGSRRMPAVAR